MVIPTKNGAATIGRVLEMVMAQGVEGLEVIAVDSGSTDGTLDILSRYGARVIRVPPHSFTHGRSRNLGARAARGEYLVFLNQDAVPCDGEWLPPLLDALEIPGVAASFSRQVPYPWVDPLERALLERIYPPEPRLVALRTARAGGLPGTVLLSSVSMAIRADLFRRYWFNEGIVMSEDQDLAFRLLHDGYSIAYEPRSRVWHGHSYGPVRNLRRHFDSGWSLSLLPYPRMPGPSLGEMVGVLRDAYRLPGPLRDKLIAPLNLLSKAVGFWLGYHAHGLLGPLKRVLSYTELARCGRL